MSLQLFGYLLHGNPYYKPPPEKRPPPGVTRHCAVCGAAFNVDSKGHGKIYCGTVCKVKAKMNKSGPKLTKQNCEICGAEYQPKRFGQKTCNPECSEKLKRQHNLKHRQQGEKDWGYEVKCSECGTTFVKKHATHATCSKYCSNKRSRKKETERRKNERAVQAVQVG